jgi:hypothetical protein
MRVWLDDTRPAPQGWVWARTVQEILWLLSQGHVTDLSLDYDLPQTDPDRCGLEVLIALWEAGAGHPTLHLHTANPVGAAKMAVLIAMLEGSVTEKEGYESLYEIENCLED